MIIIAPFHFPKYGKLLRDTFQSKKEKILFGISKSEQNLDYSYIIEDYTGCLKPEHISPVIGAVTKKLLMLDYVAYLHAQFSSSPVFRLPIVGKSMNMDLSHFQNAFPNKKRAIKKIGAIGTLMREKLVADELKKFLMERDGQLVFISDLPMEWLRLGEYPICLTHDVCRIPQFNFNSLLNIYIHNQRLTFRIEPDILKRTLVIHSASDSETEMHRIFDVIDSLQDSLGFTSVICKSVDEISDAVKAYQPDFLIFDCHGDFDSKDLSSYLIVDGKNQVYLTGQDIVDKQISAPLVFISACSTQPNYGYVKLLSDAFLQAGAFAVTATFLPIKIIDAAALLARLLTNLKQQETKIIFSNWLAFISHTLRSILIFETVRKTRIKHKLKDEIDDNKIADILLELMIFSKRESAFEKLNKYLQSIDPSIKPSFDNLEHEWLSYTTIGRADLIYFEKWQIKHQEKNLSYTC
ncbi:CHAT domain-containing protein [Elizabethkingia anophelis]|nr:CHAT domain-containing protein [Elizabethkingia anophelis]